MEIGKKRASGPPLRRHAARAGSGDREDLRPLLFEETRLGSHPIHVIQQDECRHRFPLARQAFGDCSRKGLDIVHEASLEPREVGLLQVLGTALARIAAVQIHAPEIVLAQQRDGHHMVEAAADEAGKAPGGGVDHPALGSRHPQEREHGWAPQQAQEALAEQSMAQLTPVDPELVFDRRRGQYPLHDAPQSGYVLDVPLDGESDQAGGTTVVEALAPGPRRLEESYLAVPERARRLREGRAKCGVDLARAAGAALAEEGKERFEVERSNSCSFQLQQVILPRVLVHGEHSRPQQGVIEGIAAGAGNHQDPVGRGQGQRLAVHGRILPALVVDQAVAGDGFEYPPSEPSAAPQVGHVLVRHPHP
jgi:hypothetical protein